MFLLAAVIISAIVVSFAFTANEARVNNEPDNFRDISYEVKKETGAVMDYQVYTGFNDDANLTEFVDLLAEDFYEQDSGLNIMFIYGNSSNVTFRNYGAQTVGVRDGPVHGAATKITSTIWSGGTVQEVEERLQDYEHEGHTGALWTKNWGSTNHTDINVEVEVSGQKFNVSFSQNRQVIFIIQKEVGDENYIST